MPKKDKKSKSIKENKSFKYTYPKDKKSDKNSKSKKKKYKKRNWNEYLLDNDFKENINIKKFIEENNKKNNGGNINEEKTKNVEVKLDDNKEKDIIEYILDPNENTKENNLKDLKSDESYMKKYISQKGDNNIDDNISNKNLMNDELNNYLNNDLDIWIKKVTDYIDNYSFESSDEKENIIYDNNDDNNIDIIQSSLKNTSKKIEESRNVNNINKEFDKNETKNKTLSKDKNLNVNIEIKFKDDNILYDGKIFKNFSRVNRYQKKDNIKRIIYKCINYRKNEYFRKDINSKSFCNATIVYIEPNQNIKSGYFLEKDHSKECYELYSSNIKIEVKKNKDKEEFIKFCEDLLNNSSIYDRRLFKTSFKDIYNKHKYNFSLNDNFLSNIINKWKNNSYKFKKECVNYNIYDYQNRLILREYRNIYIDVPNKKESILLSYIIWGNDENIRRIRISKNIFIDGTFHHPPEYKQMLILMYKDVLTNLKIPAFYILLNGKYERFYEIVLENVNKIINDNNKYMILYETIVTDSEKALVNVIKKIFPNTQRISCYFHYKQDLIKNIKIYGLYTKKYKDISNIIIKKLSILPIKYGGDTSIVYSELDKIIEEYPLYENFIENYFKKQKLEYFKDNSLNYQNIPIDCRTNNFLENYNGYIKSRLGQHRVINWVNFIDFIKKESERSIEKLINHKNFNSDIMNYYKDNNININSNQLKTKKEQKKNLLNLEQNIIENNNINETKIEKPNTVYESLVYNQIGFINLGNTCYANACLQILIHCEPFINKFINKIKAYNPSKTERIISNKFYLILQEILQSNHLKDYSIDMSSFLYSFSNKHKTYEGHLQHDFQEFCRIFLDDINKELNENVERLSYKELNFTNKHSKLLCEKEFHDFFEKYEKSIVTEIFYSEIMNIYICSCNKETYTFQKILDIPLLLPRNINHLSIENLLDEYFSFEEVEFLNICENWKKNIKHKKKFLISRPPLILSLSLQRIDNITRIKNDFIVTFPEKLNLKKYIDKDFGFSDDSFYNLISIVNHKGELDFGHYYSYIKFYKKNLWYKFNDTEVTKIGEKVNDINDSYILFYLKNN